MSETESTTAEDTNPSPDPGEEGTSRYTHGTEDSTDSIFRRFIQEGEGKDDFFRSLEEEVEKRLMK